MIPKKIHYCWFGNGEKPKLYNKCVNTWKKYCPDYEIIEWNESNFDIAINDYVKEAYKEKKWAFVSDYARLWIVYNYGGIYLDTDVEVVRNLDVLLDNKAFLGLEDEEFINTGVGFGAEKGNSIIKCMLDSYENIHFMEDGKIDLMTCPVRNTEAIRDLLPKKIGNKTIYLNDATIYPSEFFCPMDYMGNLKKTKNTYSIHWYSATWLDDDQKVIHNFRLFREKCEKICGRKLGGYVCRAVYLLFPRKRKILKKYS